MQDNAISGTVVVNINGKTYRYVLSGNDKFAHELRLALEGGYNPAEALAFLAETAAKYCYYRETQMKIADELKWNNYFPRIPRKRPLMIVK